MPASRQCASLHAYMFSATQIRHARQAGMLRRHWLHSESWWPRLLRGQPAIAWDDYEKDYSDLPREARALYTLFTP